MQSPAPASSSSISLPPPMPSFPESMVGKTLHLLLPYHDATIRGIERSKDDKLTRVKIEALPGVAFSSGQLRLESTTGLKFEGALRVDDISRHECTLTVHDDQVHYCRSCTGVRVPTFPPFSETMVGMTVRFSGSDPYSIEVGVREVERRDSVTTVHLQTGVVSVPACTGDMVILRSTDTLDKWQGDIRYWPNPSFTAESKKKRKDKSKIDQSFYGQQFERDVWISVRDEQVCIGSKLSLWVPNTKILIKPAPNPPANIRISHGKSVSQRKRRSSTQEECDGKQKIKVAINGYGNIGRALARAAFQSEDVALVAINDLSAGDEFSCMFRDIWDFGVKNCTSDILEGVHFYKASDPAAVPWYMTGAQFVVETSSDCSQDAEHYKKHASRYRRCSDLRLFDPLKTIVGPCDPSLSAPNSSRAPILEIEPVTPSDAKAVCDCFPLWTSNGVGSVVCVQGVDITFELVKTHMLILSNTRPSLNFAQLVRWCFDMLSQIPEAGECHVQMSEKPRWM
ncbi:uncharacterized protein LOC123447691 isoform X1 [Hordeum vulgare subsp. vulgare]|uniref:uncharacterized protein LOC123447691 isoform X1 n=2 Tax=Hordeum vulgare subsp. vulgare TaxID=112509 RepID=UPI000B463083|nr:uncharacterized protein LOC123447691 isoform X1 [Hordeum vulgare subsp. vulgare]